MTAGVHGSSTVSILATDEGSITHQYGCPQTSSAVVELRCMVYRMSPREIVGRLVQEELSSCEFRTAPREKLHPFIFERFLRAILD
jgi:hypothetical protein